jgi:YD repeat-containing protein
MLYLEHFPRDRFHIVTFESFKGDPRGCLAGCLAFLGLDDDLLPDLSATPARNVSYRYNGFGRLVSTLLNERGAFKRLTGLAKQILPAGLYQGAGRLLTRPIPPLDAALRTELEARMAPRMAAFAELTGISYPPSAAPADEKDSHFDCSP